MGGEEIILLVTMCCNEFHPSAILQMRARYSP